MADPYRSLIRTGYFLTFGQAGPPRYAVDIDRVDFKDPQPNPEETILAMEAFVGRGFWYFGTPIEHRPNRPHWREYLTPALKARAAGQGSSDSKDEEPKDDNG